MYSQVTDSHESKGSAPSPTAATDKSEMPNTIGDRSSATTTLQLAICGPQQDDKQDTGSFENSGALIDKDTESSKSQDHTENDFEILQPHTAQCQGVSSTITGSSQQLSPGKSIGGMTDRPSRPAASSLANPNTPPSSTDQANLPTTIPTPHSFAQPFFDLDSDDEAQHYSFNCTTRSLFPPSQPTGSRIGTAPEADHIRFQPDDIFLGSGISNYDSEFAKHMDERRKIQEQMEERNAEGLGIPSTRDILSETPQNSTKLMGTPQRMIYPDSFSSNESPRHIEPWRRRLQDTITSQPNQRPDVQSRNTALDAISNILFNWDGPLNEAVSLLDDICATANEVGVPTAEILAQNVTLGSHDLGMTPLCLEASRLDLDAGLDLVMWLLQNVLHRSIEKDLRAGCLMRNNGMGDQVAWSTMKLLVPEQEDRVVFTYDVTVEKIHIIQGEAMTTNPLIEEKPETAQDSDDEGSLYDDVSLVDAESSLNQADIETLKSSDDEQESADPTNTAYALGPTTHAHRARIDAPLFEAVLTFEDEETMPAYTTLSRRRNPQTSLDTHSGHRVLKIEWMHEGRVWALSMGEDILILTLRYASEVIPHEPVKVKAFIRILPADVEWYEVAELSSLGSDRLLQTHSNPAVPSIVPVYSCEFDETELTPGPVALRGRSSMSKESIRMSSLSLLEMIGTGGTKVEVVIKTTETLPQSCVSNNFPSKDSSIKECRGQSSRTCESKSEEIGDGWQKVDI